VAKSDDPLWPSPPPGPALAPDACPPVNTPRHSLNLAAGSAAPPPPCSRAAAQPDSPVSPCVTPSFSSLFEKAVWIYYRPGASSPAGCRAFLVAARPLDANVIPLRPHFRAARDVAPGATFLVRKTGGGVFFYFPLHRHPVPWSVAEGKGRPHVIRRRTSLKPPSNDAGPVPRCRTPSQTERSRLSFGLYSIRYLDDCNT
jgi:hypothetical protein